ncbi:invasion associated locus B family protein [Aureimonas sp. Leaf454]|uniref:invasion associated locus B family protein n=1 Tax=Aureimonas sp. Leaf454 TaxID=1736381 RepID=UPI0009EC3B80|nr:invasion associated locus B family protein [Aureimonas sp. Leaf454]
MNHSLHVTRKALRSGMAGLAVLGALTGSVVAQEAPAKAPAAKAPAKAGAAAQPAVAGQPSWFKVCTPQGDNTICNTQYTMIADTRQLITAINLIDVKGKVNQKVLQVVVPTGRVIPAGIQMQVDQNAPAAIGYSVCFPDRCIAEAQLTDAIINSMKKGNGLTVTSINFQRQANPIKITLSGFTGAFDGPPAAQPELAQRQEELDKALQKQAETRRKKFEDAQAAAKTGEAAPAQ